MGICPSHRASEGERALPGDGGAGSGTGGSGDSDIDTGQNESAVGLGIGGSGVGSVLGNRTADPPYTHTSTTQHSHLPTPPHRASTFCALIVAPTSIHNNKFCVIWVCVSSILGLGLGSDVPPNAEGSGDSGDTEPGSAVAT